MTSKEAFERFFTERWPGHVAVLNMYEEDSLAVSGLDVMLPRRTRNVAKEVWEYAVAWQREQDARICMEKSKQHSSGWVAIECAQAIREQGEMK